FTLLSCQDDAGRENRADKDHFKLSYTIPQATSVITRSDVALVNGEDQLNSFYILFFENDSEGAGEFIAAIDVMEENQGTLSGSGILDIDLPKGSGLSVSAAYKMLVCANIETYIPAIQNLAGLEAFCRNRSEKEVMQSLRLQVTEGIPGTHEEDYQPVAADNLPMSAAIVKQAGQQQVSVNLVRAVSRFDVINQASGYELKSVALWNATTSTLLWKQAGTHFAVDRTSRYYSVTATGNRITGGLYSFENFVELPEQGDTETTTLVIGMENQSTGLTEYFRTNIYALSKSQKLKRNNVYTSTIREVLGSGYFTEREAYESTEELLSSDINGWTTELGENVVYDDDHILAMPTSVITLAMAGDTRTYNIFTDGEGTLGLDTEGIPSGVSVSLVGNHVKIDAPVSSAEWSGLLTFSLGNLTLSMRVEQREYIKNYLSLNYDVAGLPAFGYEAGDVSDDIEVTSSGAWVAQIYGDNYFSFSASDIRTTLEGGPGTNLNIYTSEENKTSVDRRGFVIFTLKEDPEITRVMVIEQAKYEEYIRFVKEDNKSLNYTAHTYRGLTLESNAEWEITNVLAPNGGTMTFTNDNNQVVALDKSTGTKKLILHVTASTGKLSGPVVIFAKTKGGKTTDIIIMQRASGASPEPDPEPTDRAMWFVTYGTGIGNLSSPSSDGYKHYVYGLGENMRNSSKFGNGGSLANIGKDAFTYTNSFNADNIAKAKVIQLLSNPTAANFDRIYTAMQKDPSMFLMITSRDPAVINNILAQFKSKTNAGYGSAVDIANDPYNVRPLNTVNTSKLMKYMLGDGPGGNVVTSQISLQSSVGQKGAALPPAAYPATFVPIIMANRNNDYCVFGIDPVHRLIIMTDPGVFGAAPAYVAYPGYKNYLDPRSANSVFLDNLTAWIINATGAKNFLQGYQ
ncbi:MAG: hypothetical protein LUD74_05605, partial [Tannerellaceae bacterium]|nr:hypothetical protein [Tannerellaceae bacterium]